MAGVDGRDQDADLIPEPGSFYIMDRGYLDFERLYILTQCMAFFIINKLFSRPHETYREWFRFCPGGKRFLLC